MLGADDVKKYLWEYVITLLDGGASLSSIFGIMHQLASHWVAPSTDNNTSSHIVIISIIPPHTIIPTEHGRDSFLEAFDLFYATTDELSAYKHLERWNSTAYK